MKLPLAPLFQKLGITEATTPEEIRAIAQQLRELADNGEDITDGFKTEDVSEEAQKSAEKFNAGEDDEEDSESEESEDTEKTDEKSSASAE